MKSITNYINEGGCSSCSSKQKRKDEDKEKKEVGLKKKSENRKDINESNSDDYSDEFEAYRKEFNNYWIPSIKKFYKVIKSTNIITACVWFTDCDTDYYEFAKYEYENISTDVKKTFVSVDVSYCDNELESPELHKKISKLLEEEPYDYNNTFWRFDRIETPQDLVDFAYEIEAIDRQLKRYSVEYFPFLDEDGGESDGEWEEKTFADLDDAKKFYDSLKMWKDVRFKTLYDGAKRKVIAQEK